MYSGHKDSSGRVTSREGRVSRNLIGNILVRSGGVTSREGRVSRNVSGLPEDCVYVASRPARDV